MMLRPLPILSVVFAGLSGTVVAASSAGSARMVSTGAGDGQTGNGASDNLLRVSPAFGKAVSADGHFVAFSSSATNLIADMDISTSSRNVYLRDRQSGTTLLVSHAAGQSQRAGNGRSSLVALSPNGRFVLFDSVATDLVAGVADTNQATDVFLFDRADGSVSLVSVAASGTATGNGASTGGDVSDDGDVVLFDSRATDLLIGFTDRDGPGQAGDVFRRVRSTSATTLMSHQAGAANATGNGGSRGFRLSADGRYAMFVGEATDVVTGVVDSAGTTDVFVHDAVTGTSVLASRSSANPSVTVGDNMNPIALTPDGRYALMAKAQGYSLLFDRSTGEVETISDGTAAGMSSDARYVAFESISASVVPGVVDTNGTFDAFLVDRTLGTRTLLSHSLGSATTAANQLTHVGGISADGSRVVLSSSATDLVPQQSSTIVEDAFLYDTATGVNTRISGAIGSVAVRYPAFATGLSSDGGVVAFESALTSTVPGDLDRNAVFDVFTYDAIAGTRETISHSAVARPAPTVRGADLFGVSADGRWCQMISPASDYPPPLLDGTPTSDLFLVDVDSGAQTLITHAIGNPSQSAGTQVYVPILSRDGRFSAFVAAGGLVAGEVNPAHTNLTYVYDRDTGTTTLVSHTVGTVEVNVNGSTRPVAVSSDGRWLLFQGLATNVVANQVDPTYSNDVFVFDRQSGTSRLVSGSNGSPSRVANAGSSAVAISDDGRWVVFNSGATDLMPALDLTNSFSNVYLRDMTTGQTRLVSHVPGNPNKSGDFVSVATAATPDGRYVLILSDSTTLSGDGGDPSINAAFVWDRDTDTLEPVARPVSETAPGQFPVATGLSADGRWVMFGSAGDTIVPGQSGTPGNIQTFLRDRRAGVTYLASHAVGSATTVADGGTIAKAISADGNCVLFASSATNLAAPAADPAVASLYRYCLDDEVALVTPSALRPGTVANGGSSATSTAFARGGSRVLFTSTASDLDPSVIDTNGITDGFVFDRVNGRFADGFE